MHQSTYPAADDKAIVYIREADRGQLPDHLKDAPGKIFAVHNPEGQIVALSPDRKQAFAIARLNNLTPVSVH